MRIKKIIMCERD